MEGSGGHDSPDPFAKAVRGVGRFLTRHHQPSLAQACVQVLVRAPGREVEVRDRSGNLQLVDTRDQMGANLLVGRYRLPPRVVEQIRPGDWVLDVGANIGIVTSQLAAVVGRSGRVWAFEPVPANVERLRFLQARNGLSQVEIFPHAVGAESGSVALGMPPPGRSGWGSITKSWDIADRLDVPMRPLDHVVERAARGGDRVRLIKVDVEGFEFEVLQGAGGLLGEHRPLVFCEFNDVLLRDRGRSSEELLERFDDLGYRPAGQGAVPRRLANRVVNLLLTPDPAHAHGAA